MTIDKDPSGNGRTIIATKSEKARVLSRSETHDLSMIIKDRTKVLKAYAEEQAATCMADFEKKLAAVYSFDKDEIWKAATEVAQKVVAESQAKIAKRCRELGIPESFAPGLDLQWRGRGENAIRSRRDELRRVAKSSIEAMTKAAITKIEKQSLELRTQVVAMGLLSPEAKVFLESLTPIESAMSTLDFAEIENKLEREQPKRLAAHHRLYGEDY
jgi:hypothetical protein